jgi:hypothetical protein
VAVDGDEIVPWSLFVKVLQAWRHFPGLDLIPPPLRESMLVETNWRYEADLYASRFGEFLPEGLRLPAFHHRQELGDERVALWLEDVRTLDVAWGPDRFARASRLLGRSAARSNGDGVLPDARPALARSFTRAFVAGRLEPFVLPLLDGDEVWTHPLIRRVGDDDLRGDLAELARRVPALADALDRLPTSPAHGDACPQNLLVSENDPDGFVVIDWSMAGRNVVGFDLGQLLVGLAHDGVLTARDLPALHELVLSAYIDGLAEEGMPAEAEAVRFGFDAAMVVRSAFTALPLELLGDRESDDPAGLIAARLELARYLVDLGLGLSRAR